MSTEGDKKFKILIVDDVPKNIQVAANILQKEGYLMAFAQNGTTALNQARCTKFDLILLDIMMPDMDGYEVCRELRSDPATKDIPIIFLTAKTDTDSVIRGFDLGAMDYVAKPFNGAELLARVKTHLELNHTREQLVDANVTKDKFFSIIAHDLKNPFNALIGLSKMLLNQLDRMDEAKMKEIVRMIYDSSNHTYQLLENLLDWSRMQTGKMQWKPMEIGIGAIAYENVCLLKAGAEKKEISLSSDVGSDTLAYADPNMVTMVVRNLLSNAVKFTGKGGSVHICSETRDQFEEIAVIDTGVGMKPEDVEKLFRIDVHHSTPGTDKEAGTGLGLILCRDFIQKNGGDIRVESEMGKGSRFVFTLPKSAGALSGRQPSEKSTNI